MAGAQSKSNGGETVTAKPAPETDAMEKIVHDVEDEMVDLTMSLEDAATDAVAAGESLMYRGLGFYRESLRFAAERIKQDIELQEKLLECRDPRDFFEVQAGFFSDMARQYATEYQKMMGVALKIPESLQHGQTSARN